MTDDIREPTLLAVPAGYADVYQTIGQAFDAIGHHYPGLGGFLLLRVSPQGRVTVQLISEFDPSQPTRLVRATEAGDDNLPEEGPQ